MGSPNMGALLVHAGYEAILQIGAGGTASVYVGAKARATRRDDLVVIKELRPELVGDERATAMLVREASVGQRLDHPNIVRTHELVVVPPAHFLIIGFVDGQSLLDLLRKQGRAAMPLEEHLVVLCEVLKGLEYLHELSDEVGRPSGLVHQDISPSNVLIGYDGKVTLVDFGNARAVGSVPGAEREDILGKVGYAAPEQCLGQPADIRSDLYAVGVMLWEAIAGQRRTPSDSWESVLEARIRGSEPALETMCPDSPRDLCELTRRALFREAELRFASAREFRAALEGCLSARYRRPRQADLGRLMQACFAQERVWRNNTTDNWLSAQEPPTRPDDEPHSFTATAVESRNAPTSQEGPSAQDTRPLPVNDALLVLSRQRDALSAPPSRDTGPRTRPFLLGAALTAAVATVVMLRVQPSTRGTRPDEIRVVRPVPDAKATATLPSREEFGASQLPRAGLNAGHPPIKLRVMTRPRKAKLFLDGRPLDENPFVDLLADDGREHELTVTSPGFVADVRTLLFDRDIDLEVRLRPQTVTANRELPAPPVMKLAAPSLEPGMDLSPARSVKLAKPIDDQDPYR